MVADANRGNHVPRASVDDRYRRVTPIGDVHVRPIRAHQRGERIGADRDGGLQHTRVSIDHGDGIGQVAGHEKRRSIWSEAQTDRPRRGAEWLRLALPGAQVCPSSQLAVNANAIRVDDVVAAAGGINVGPIWTVGKPEKDRVGYQVGNRLNNLSSVGIDDLERLDTGAAVADQQMPSVWRQNGVDRIIAGW